MKLQMDVRDRLRKCVNKSRREALRAAACLVAAWLATPSRLLGQDNKEKAQMKESDAKVRPFLMFQGKAEEAMNFYVSLFPGAKVLDIVRYGPNGPGAPGSVTKASFRIASQTIMCIDSYVKHDFSFTPAFSLFVECESQDEIDRLYAALVAGGKALMPIGEYGFSRKFGWVNDRYGVSWQLNLA
jgi:predicted 3-demethylubiquinone-9 3-methyltransferase (glyoxalase superfamily)